MDDEASSSPAASYIRLVQHLIEKCICYKLDKEECIETLEKHAKIMPVITSTVWKELEKENREFFETYKKDRGGGPNQEASAGPGHHPSRVQQSGCSSQASSTLQKNPSDQQEQRIPVEIKKEKRKNPSDDFSKENPSVDQKQHVMEKQENRKNNPCASKSSDKDK